MKIKLAISICLCVVFASLSACSAGSSPVAPTPLSATTQTSTILAYHPIQVDADGKILPWYSPDLGKSYDHIIRLLFEWWLNMPRNPKEPDLPYYLMHQVWRPAPDFDKRGLGGSQLEMALCSWRLYYAYSGDPRALEDMRRIADHVLVNGLSKPTDAWANIPYPYNSTQWERYDGDMIYGAGYTQPDKAGSLGYELLNLYKITTDEKYLKAAVAIADTLAGKVQPGDADNSPMPFKVRADTGALTPDGGNRYTTNYAGTLLLFEGLQELGQGNAAVYQKAHDTIIAWIKAYPMRTKAWGPFFEDIPSYSDTQINAVTMAMYVMDEGEAWGTDWKHDARSMLDWPLVVFANPDWNAFGVVVVNEQTVYQAPGSSHSSRQASMELRYAEVTGENRTAANAIRMLNWATYMVDFDGKNRYLNDDIWLTDGYGDYVRHYLRAMASEPSLAPGDQDHLLRTSSVVQEITYKPDGIVYTTFPLSLSRRGRSSDASATDVLRIATFKVGRVLVDGKPLKRLMNKADLASLEGYVYNAAGDAPGVLRIHRSHGQKVEILP